MSDDLGAVSEEKVDTQGDGKVEQRLHRFALQLPRFDLMQSLSALLTYDTIHILFLKKYRNLWHIYLWSFIILSEVMLFCPKICMCRDTIVIAIQCGH